MKRKIRIAVVTCRDGTWAAFGAGDSDKNETDTNMQGECLGCLEDEVIAPCFVEAEVEFPEPSVVVAGNVTA